VSLANFRPKVNAKICVFWWVFRVQGILGGTLACAGHLLVPTIREGVVEG
jgi:hypothetical protein